MRYDLGRNDPQFVQYFLHDNFTLFPLLGGVGNSGGRVSPHVFSQKKIQKEEPTMK